MIGNCMGRVLELPIEEDPVHGPSQRICLYPPGASTLPSQPIQPNLYSTSNSKHATTLATPAKPPCYSRSIAILPGRYRHRRHRAPPPSLAMKTAFAILYRPSHRRITNSHATACPPRFPTAALAPGCHVWASPTPYLSSIAASHRRSRRNGCNHRLASIAANTETRTWPRHWLARRLGACSAVGTAELCWKNVEGLPPHNAFLSCERGGGAWLGPRERCGGD
jgi:hypothetical protein